MTLLLYTVRDACTHKPTLYSNESDSLEMNSLNWLPPWHQRTDTFSNERQIIVHYEYLTFFGSIENHPWDWQVFILRIYQNSYQFSHFADLMPISNFICLSNFFYNQYFKKTLLNMPNSFDVMYDCQFVPLQSIQLYL